MKTACKIASKVVTAKKHMPYIKRDHSELYDDSQRFGSEEFKRALGSSQESCISQTSRSAQRTQTLF